MYTENNKIACFSHFCLKYLPHENNTSPKNFFVMIKEIKSYHLEYNAHLRNEIKT